MPDNEIHPDPKEFLADKPFTAEAEKKAEPAETFFPKGLNITPMVSNLLDDGQSILFMNQRQYDEFKRAYPEPPKTKYYGEKRIANRKNLLCCLW